MSRFPHGDLSAKKSGITKFDSHYNQLTNEIKLNHLRITLELCQAKGRSPKVSDFFTLHTSIEKELFIDTKQVHKIIVTGSNIAEPKSKNSILP